MAQVLGLPARVCTAASKAGLTSCVASTNTVVPQCQSTLKGLGPEAALGVNQKISNEGISVLH